MGKSHMWYKKCIFVQITCFIWTSDFYSNSNSNSNSSNNNSNITYHVNEIKHSSSREEKVICSFVWRTKANGNELHLVSIFQILFLERDGCCCCSCCCCYERRFRRSMFLTFGSKWEHRVERQKKTRGRQTEFQDVQVIPR